MPASATAARTWYVGAGAGHDGDGSRGAPFGSLAAVEAAAGPQDTIVVLAGSRALDGGIALKTDQHLVGDGPSVTALPASAAAPRIANTTSAHGGDAVILADGAAVENIAVTGARRGGIYGADVREVTVSGNDVTATNTSCTTGFVVQPFVLPSLVPGVGVPFSGGLSNGWAAIMVDASHVAATVTIARNRVHDATCADGIDVRASGTADVTAHVHDNLVTHMRQDPSMQSILAIGMQTTGTAQLVADLVFNTETFIGSDGLGDFGDADSEGLFANSAGRSRLTEVAERNAFAHGLGHISANCVEVAASNGGPTMSFTLRNSTCDGVVGDVLEAGNLSENSTMTMVIDHVRAAHSTFAGAQAFHLVEPGDDGDCLLQVTSGSGSSTDVTIRDSELTDCVADGVGVVSNAAAGDGSPIRHVGLDVRNSRIGSNRVSNVRVANVSPITRLDVRVERTDLAYSGGADVFLEGLDTSGGTHARLDLGGGGLGSDGHNCILGGGQGDITGTGFALSAAQAWWGTAGGPAPGRVLVVNGGVATDAALASADCGPPPGTVVGPLPGDTVSPPPRCTSVRRIVLHLPRGWRRAAVRVDGRRARVRRVGGRLTVTVRVKPGARVVVRARGTDRHGRRVRQIRRLRGC